MKKELVEVRLRIHEDGGPFAVFKRRHSSYQICRPTKASLDRLYQVAIELVCEGEWNCFPLPPIGWTIFR